MPDLSQALRVLLGPDKQSIALIELMFRWSVLWTCGPAARQRVREQAVLESQ